MNMPWDGQKWVLAVFLYWSPLYILRQGLSLKLVFTDSANLTGQWTLASSSLHSAGITEVHPHNQICMCWESELRSSRFCGNHFPGRTMPTSPSSPLRLIKLQGLHSPSLAHATCSSLSFPHIQWAPLGQCCIPLDSFPVFWSSTT